MSKLLDVPIDLETKFKALAEKWREETGFLSDSDKASAHPAYQEIIRLGPPVVPILLRHMAQTNWHWFEALSAITGEQPIPAEHAGRIRLMVEDWLDWGRNRGLI